MQHQDESHGDGVGAGAVPPAPSPNGESRPARIAPGDPAAVVVQAALAIGVHRLGLHEPGARRGDVEGVHRFRASLRRLRSELRAFRGLLDADWADRLADELKWLADVLGAVRDLDVLLGRLRIAAGASTEALAPLFVELGERHARSSEVLRNALLGERYQALVHRLAQAALHPGFRDDAWEPCRSALPPLVAAFWQALKRRARALRPADPAEDFHEVRIRAKRVRYAAEAVLAALEPRAARDATQFARRATQVQDVLGEYHDAVVACAEIQRVVAEHPSDGPFNLAAGRLLERQEQAATDARDRFFEVWSQLDRKKIRRWMKA
jgi:CHAD domain-containing protein